LLNVVGAQYRRLWDLRATLEQSEDLSDDGQADASTSIRAGETESSAGARERPGNIAPSFLPLPASELRRHTYQHLAAERRLRQPGTGATAAAATTAAGGSSGGPSADSVETDGDASDTSRHDVTTTSFESSTTTTTTTTTDNNTDAGDGRAAAPCPIANSLSYTQFTPPDTRLNKTLLRDKTVLLRVLLSRVGRCELGTTVGD